MNSKRRQSRLMRRFAGIVLPVALIAAGGSLGAVEKKPPPPKTLTFDMVNPTAAQLKDKFVEVAPGMRMEVGRYLTESNFKSNPKISRFFSADFQKKYLIAPPTYKEEVKAIGDRLVVDRTLVLETADPCAIPSDGKADISVCFKMDKTGAKPIPADVKKELLGIRQKLSEQKKKGTSFGGAVEKRFLQDADKISAMSDQDLLGYLLNTADTKKVITQHSVVPFASYAFDKIPKLDLTEKFDAPLPSYGKFDPGAASSSSTQSGPAGQTGHDSLASNGTKTGIDPKTLLPPNEADYPIYGEPLTFGTTSTQMMEFLNGFTWGYNFADVYEVTFAGETLLTDRYYARFTYDVGVGVGLRFPLEVSAESEIMRVDTFNGPADGVAYPASRLCLGVRDKAKAKECAHGAKLLLKAQGKDGDAAFYSRQGVPSTQIFDGNEFVFSFYVNAELYASLPGPNFSASLSKGINRNRNYTTPVEGGAVATLVELEIDGHSCGLEVAGGVSSILSGYAALNPGIVVRATDGRVKAQVAPKNAKLASGESEKLLDVPENTFASIGIVERTDLTADLPWGATVGPIDYSTQITVTPQVSVTIGLDLLGWGWNYEVGPFVINQLSASVGTFSFPAHEGTPASREHVVTTRSFTQ